MDTATLNAVKFQMKSTTREIANGNMEILVNGRIPMLVICTFSRHGQEYTDVYTQYHPVTYKVGDFVTMAKGYYESQQIAAIWHMDGSVRISADLALQLAKF